MELSNNTAARKGVVYRSVDSQPSGLSVSVSRLRAPALLVTFSIMSVVQLWLLQSGPFADLFPHGDYILAPYSGERSIAIRTYIISFFVAYSIFASGTLRNRFAFAFDLILRFLAICAIFDLANALLLIVFGLQYPLALAQILAGLIGFALFSFMLLAHGAMPDERPVETGEQQNLRMFLRFVATMTIAGFASAYLGSLDSFVTESLRAVTLLGGIGPGVFLLVPLLFLQLYLIGIFERKISAAKDYCAPISIIVPAFNEEHIIAETIRHIDEAAQEYLQPIEVIILDNNSADNTAEVAREALEAAHAIEGRIIHVAQAGKAHALNRGVQAATHEVVLRIDADTQIRADNIRLAVQNFHDPHVGVVGGIPVPPGGGLFDRARLVEVTLKHGYYAPALSAFRGLIGVPGMFAMYRADILRQAGSFATGMNGEDTDISLRISELGYHAVVDPRVRYISEVPATVAHMREQRLRWFRSTYHVTSRAKDVLWSRRLSIRAKLVLPYMLLNSARRAMMVPILFFGLFQLITETDNDSGLIWQSIIAVLVGAPALVAVFALLANREWRGLLAMPEYLAFRALRAWYTLESLLSIRIHRSKKSQYETPETSSQEQLA